MPVAGIRNVKACDIAAAEAHGRVCLPHTGLRQKTEKAWPRMWSLFLRRQAA